MKLDEFRVAVQKIVAEVNVPSLQVADLPSMARIIASVGVMVDLGVPEAQLVYSRIISKFCDKELLPEMLSKGRDEKISIGIRSRLLCAAYDTNMSLGMNMISTFYDKTLDALYDLSYELERNYYASVINEPRTDDSFLQLRLASMAHCCYHDWTIYDENGVPRPLSSTQEAVISFCQKWARDLQPNGSWIGIARKEALQRLCLMREVELKSGNNAWHEAQQRVLPYYGEFTVVPEDGFSADELDAAEALLEAMSSTILTDEDTQLLNALRRTLSQALTKHMQRCGIDSAQVLQLTGLELKAVALSAATDAFLIIDNHLR